MENSGSPSPGGFQNRVCPAISDIRVRLPDEVDLARNLLVQSTGYFVDFTEESGCVERSRSGPGSSNLSQRGKSGHSIVAATAIAQKQ